MSNSLSMYEIIENETPEIMEVTLPNDDIGNGSTLTKDKKEDSTTESSSVEQVSTKVSVNKILGMDQ